MKWLSGAKVVIEWSGTWCNHRHFHVQCNWRRLWHKITWFFCNSFLRSHLQVVQYFPLLFTYTCLSLWDSWAVFNGVFPLLWALYVYFVVSWLKDWGWGARLAVDTVTSPANEGLTGHLITGSVQITAEKHLKGYKVYIFTVKEFPSRWPEEAELFCWSQWLKC